MFKRCCVNILCCSLSDNLGTTLRRGAGIIGNALGDFFGVTEVSQRGNTAEGRLGWEQYTERRAEEVIKAMHGEGGRKGERERERESER